MVSLSCQTRGEGGNETGFRVLNVMNPENQMYPRDGMGPCVGAGSWQGLIPCLLLTLLLLGTTHGLAQIVSRPPATQTIALQKGWNAIYVQVDPADRDPAKVFAGLPVLKVAAYLPSRTPVEFIQDPTSKAWKKEGWSVWYGPGTSEEGLSDLYAIPGGRGYLVNMAEAGQLTLHGFVIFPQTLWRADAYNFVGFQVDPVSPPTFAAWFAGSPNHQSTRRPTVYSLDATGHWVPVERMDQVQIQPGRAYWVFCQGGSSYQGPLSVIGTAGRLDYGDVTKTLAVRMINPLSNPLSVTMEVVEADSLPLVYEKMLLSLGQTLLVPMDSAVVLPTIEAGDELQVRLSLDRAGMTRKAGTAVLVLRDSVGSLLRIPVTGKLP